MADSTHQRVDSVACQTTGGVQDQIIHIRGSDGEGELNDLNDQGNGCTCQNYLGQGVDLFVDDGSHNTRRDKKGEISDEIDQQIEFRIKVQQIYKGNQIDSDGEYGS